MDPKTILGALAGVVAFGAYVRYFVSIVRGESKPNRTTWWIWAIMGAILALSYYFTGARNTMWAATAEFLGPFTVAVLSLRYGEGGLKDKRDLTCMVGAVLSIVLWILTDDPLIALVSGLLVDTFAIVPTIVKSYLRSEDEDFGAWFGTWVSDGMNMFAVESLRFGILVYPIYMFVSTSIVVAILFVKRLSRSGRRDKLIVGKSRIQGQGVIANMEAKPGDPVLDIVGRPVSLLITSPEIADSASVNWMGVAKNEWIEPDCLLRHVNHSCSPNAGVRGRAIVARQRIAPGDEVTIDYSLNEADVFWSMPCQCGSGNCRQVVTSVQSVPLGILADSWDWIPPYHRYVCREFHRSKFKSDDDFKRSWVSFLRSPDAAPDSQVEVASDFSIESTRAHTLLDHKPRSDDE